MSNRHPGWPATLAYGPVGLRPMRLRDAGAWSELRIRNEAWLAPWEPSSHESWVMRHTVSAYPPLLSRLRKLARAGSALPWAVTYEGQLAGQLSVTNIVRGASLSGQIGYWLDQRVAGR